HDADALGLEVVHVHRRTAAGARASLRQDPLALRSARDPGEGEALALSVVDRVRVGLHAGGAGGRPGLRMTSMTFAMSGGPPAFTTAPMSRKYCGPRSPGVIALSSRTGSLPVFVKPCPAPRGGKRT